MYWLNLRGFNPFLVFGELVCQCDCSRRCLRDDPLLPELLARFRQKLYSTQKRTLVKIPEVDATLDKAAKSLDAAGVKTLIKEVYRYGYDQYLWIPICSINDEIATTKRIPKWNPSRRRNDRNYNDLIRQR